MSTESTAGFDVRYDPEQYAYGVIRVDDGKWADKRRYDLKPDAQEHKDWLAKQDGQSQ